MDIEIPPDPAMAEVLAVEEEVETVADEILIEVKQCQTKLENLTADLARLQSADQEGQENQRTQREQITELLSEIKNSRVELKSLREQVEASMERQVQQTLVPSASLDSPPSIPSELPSTPVNEGAVPLGEPRRKRYRMI